MLTNEKQLEIKLRFALAVLKKILPHVERWAGADDERVVRIRRALEESAP
jgi:hypothetical protein